MPTRHPRLLAAVILAGALVADSLAGARATPVGAAPVSNPGSASPTGGRGADPLGSATTVPLLRGVRRAGVGPQPLPTAVPATTSTTMAPPSPSTAVPPTAVPPTTGPASTTTTVTSAAPAAPDGSSPTTSTTAAPLPPEVAALQLDTIDDRFVRDVQAEVGSAQEAFDLARATQVRAHADADTKAALLVQATERVSQLDDSQRRAATAVVSAHDRVRSLAVAAYVTGGPGSPVNALLSAESIGDFARRQAIFTTVANDSAAALAGYVRARDEAARATLRSVDGLAAARAATAVADQRTTVADAAALRASSTLAARRALLILTTDAVSIPGTDVPRLVLDAYQRAALRVRGEGCQLAWWGLAGIGKVESNHGRAQHAHLTPIGDLVPHIIGIQLNGSDGTQAVPATDGGKYDGDPLFDHAVGPMQFLPSTWKVWGRDGHGAGDPDPNNVYDAALGAASYLCAASTALFTDDGLRTAYLSYNHSDDYVTEVLAYAHVYQAADAAGLVPPMSEVPLYTLAPPAPPSAGGAGEVHPGVPAPAPSTTPAPEPGGEPPGPPGGASPPPGAAPRQPTGAAPPVPPQH